MWEKIKTYYSEHTMYVNIALAIVALVVVMKVFKKK